MAGIIGIPPDPRLQDTKDVVRVILEGDNAEAGADPLQSVHFIIEGPFAATMDLVEQTVLGDDRQGP